EPDHIGSDWNRTSACLLKANGGVIGGAHSRAFSPDDASVQETLTMNGGAVMPPGGGNIEVWCSWQGDPFTSNAAAQIMATETPFFWPSRSSGFAFGGRPPPIGAARRRVERPAA